ncbi:hypothetical protein BC829DRAFT_76513 [Chytridium lagenaria]|nr:hypothetical protein BC829DRAFT_76513 [Chytridium lagenaria]
MRGASSSASFLAPNLYHIPPLHQRHGKTIITIKHLRPLPGNECFYSQIKDCHLVPAWKETATVLVWVNWGTVLLGILVTFLSVHVRRKRSLLRNIPPPDYHQLSQFEVFLALMAISCLFNAIALSLSIYVSIRTVLFTR